MPEGRHRVRRAGVDNAFGTTEDPDAVQRICDGLTDQKIYCFAGKWLARLPHPFTRADEDAGYRWVGPAGRVLHHHGPGPARERPRLLRPAHPRQPRHRPPRQGEPRVRPDGHQEGQVQDPGTFRTQVKQYLKEGKAICTETTINQPSDFGIGKELTNLAAMAKAGYAANRRLLDAEMISHDPAAGTAALETLTSPVISPACTRVPGMRFPDPRVQALLASVCALALRPPTSPAATCGTTSHPSWGNSPRTCPTQISYDLRCSDQ